jgi:hypothetical protein
VLEQPLPHTIKDDRLNETHGSTYLPSGLQQKCVGVAGIKFLSIEWQGVRAREDGVLGKRETRPC